MKLKMIVAACALVASGAALAESYQAEVNAGATRYDQDGISSSDHTYSLGGSYYFNPVHTSGLPLAESAYLGKNSNVFAGVIDYPSQHGNPSSQAYTLGAEFYIPESFLYVQAGATRLQGKHWNDNEDGTSVVLDG